MSRCCKSQDTGVCLMVNQAHAGDAYGYVNMGLWIGGQTRYVTILLCGPQPLKVSDHKKAMSKIGDLNMLGHFVDQPPWCRQGGLSASAPRSMLRYRPDLSGLTAAASARIMGATVVMIAEIIGVNEVDSAPIDTVAFEARDHAGGEQPAIALNTDDRNHPCRRLDRHSRPPK